ncbi:MAG: hypothetical protein R3E79_56765 [Caldilineaceae bacterium]
MSTDNKNHQRELLNELDRLAFWSCAIVIVILSVTYFLIAFFMTKYSILQNFLLGILTNLIPLPLLFALSYAFLRKIQAIRAVQDAAEQMEKIAGIVKQSLRDELVSSHAAVSQETSDPKRVKILFITSQPSDFPQLRTIEELSKIKENLRRARLGHTFIVEPEWGVKKADLLPLLLQHQPYIVHFACYCSTEGNLILQNDRGVAEEISQKELQKLLAAFGTSIRLVLLNCANSKSLCELLVQEIEYTIGISGDVDDDKASDFSAAFYHALAHNLDNIKLAFDLGCSRLAGTNANYVLRRR